MGVGCARGAGLGGGSADASMLVPERLGVEQRLNPRLRTTLYNHRSLTLYGSPLCMQAPSALPTGTPSVGPSAFPSLTPSLAPTDAAEYNSMQPTLSPTLQPSGSPSLGPTAAPSLAPSLLPTTLPPSTVRSPCPFMLRVRARCRSMHVLAPGRMRAGARVCVCASGCAYLHGGPEWRWDVWVGRW